MQIEPPEKPGINPWLICIVLGVLALLLYPVLSPEHSEKPPPVEPLPSPSEPLAQSVQESFQSDSIERFRPIEEPANGYLSSSVCSECHEKEHASWYASYHRTMTQLASPETVLGNFDNQLFYLPEGGTIRLGKTGDEHWVEITDHPKLIQTANGNTLRSPIVLMTGSHHMQVYWFAIGVGRSLGILPFVHLKGEERWIPRSAAFLQPPHSSSNLEWGRWNNDCSACHTTDPRALWDRETRLHDTKVSEFGIACEACHGPAQAHVSFQRDRQNLAGANLPDTSDPIVNPSTLDHRKSSQVCGACHVAHQPVDPTGKFTNYIPGTDYDKARRPLQVTEEFMNRYLGLADATNKTAAREILLEDARSIFWPDGTVRIGGREYNGLLESACHTKGEMSCLSCHQMHQSGTDKRAAKEWADDQLQPGKIGDHACLQCHEAKDYRSTEHTHHPLNSSGSSCYNCHMPHTSYALLTAIRSHTINSPMVDVSDKAGRPNACNLCHLDRTLEWTSKHLADWYGQALPQFTEEQRQVAAGPLWTLKGDAALRALMAWHIGWQPARDAALTDWSGPYLAVLADDDYPAVRVIASRTMQNLPLYRQIAYDFLADTEPRRTAVMQVMATWKKQHAGDSHDAATLVNSSDKLQGQRFRTLLNARDNRPVTLAE